MSNRFYQLRDDDRDFREDSAADRSDAGAGVDSMLGVVDWTCFGNDDADTVYARRISSAMKRIRRNSPSLLAVFKLIVRNGRNRKESIFQLLTAAERRLPDLEQTQAWSSARLLYWRSLRRLESLFGIEATRLRNEPAAEASED
jgi:hypothetical protein